MDAMIATVMDRETLDAFADGALSPERSAAVVLHLADCPGDAAYVDAVMEVNALFAAAYAEPLHQPVTERLRAAIFPPAAAPARPAVRTGWRAFRPAARIAAFASAAAAALAVGIALAPASVEDGPGTDSALRAALETTPSGPVAGDPDAPQITLIATFFDGAGRPCREYEVAAAESLTRGVACRDAASAWSDEIAVTSKVAAAEDRAGAFVPASGASDLALDGALDRLDAGMILSPAEEGALIARGWRG